MMVEYERISVTATIKKKKNEQRTLHAITKQALLTNSLQSGERGFRFNALRDVDRSFIINILNTNVTESSRPPPVAFPVGRYRSVHVSYRACQSVRSYAMF